MGGRTWNLGATALTLGSLLAMAACGGEEATEPAIPGTLEAAPSSTSLAAASVAQLGGTIIAAAQYVVEILPQSTGHIEAEIRGADGAAVQGGAGTSLTVQVQAADGSTKPVALEWNDARGAFTGELEGEVDIAPGPMQVQVTVAGASHTGRVEKVAIAPEPAHGGIVLVAEDTSAEIRTEVDGTVVAYLDGPDGEPLEGAAAATVVVKVQADDGALHPVQLAWDDAQGHYAGRVSGGVTLVPGPMELDVTVQGRIRRGRVRHVVVARAPSRGGRVVVVGDANVELVPKDDGEIEAYVVDVRGQPVSAQASIVVHVGLRPVRLVWDAAAGCFKGRAEVGVDLRADPIRVVLRREGRRYDGGVWFVPPGQRVRARAHARNRARYEDRHGDGHPGMGHGNMFGHDRPGGVFVQGQAHVGGPPPPASVMGGIRVRLGAQGGAPPVPPMPMGGVSVMGSAMVGASAMASGGGSGGGMGGMGGGGMGSAMGGARATGMLSIMGR